MDWLQTIWLALLQGLTEFLPISSSGHLVLMPYLFDWQDQGLAFDVAVHLGSLLAVISYFRRDLYLMIRDWFAQVGGGAMTEHARLAWWLIVATIPVCVAGVLLQLVYPDGIRSPWVIAWATLGFALLLWWADARGRRQRQIDEMSWRDIVWIGMAQALALIPGTSRSGITMTAGLMLGLTREAAARFSFLLSIPAIMVASGYESVKLIGQAEAVNWSVLALGVVVSGLTAFLCIHVFLRWVNTIGYLPFVIYRLLLGVVLLWALN